MLQFIKMKYLTRSLLTLSIVILCDCNTYNVKLSTDVHVNEVAWNFLSFSVDPKYLFSPNEAYSGKECICMANSLSPAYLRIAGPSTEALVFNESSIVMGQGKGLKVSPEKWQKFATWANTSNFQLVFALNPTDKSPSGLWDANSAINILTAADKSGLEDIIWELGYECSNQTIEEYLNDLQTLKVIVETFPQGQNEHWKVVAGDISNCLETESKSDFKDYITLSDDILDAVLLNGNTSSQQLETMSDKDRLSLLKLLSNSKTPLWLTEKMSLEMTELERAVDWMTSLGYSARNGFNVHFRELREDELYEPTLSFYMALLYKNFVGERVLNVKIEELGETVLFAHCTAIRQRPIPGAVTLYGANMEEETARFSIKLSRKEEGGDIIQYILKLDDNGNVIVNGRPLYQEGDMRAFVKRVRPYKTLLINLPPKSVGFWVLANTNIEACVDVESNEIGGKRFLGALPVTDIDDKTFKTEEVKKRTERSVFLKTSYKDFDDVTDYSDDNGSFDGEIDISRGNNLDSSIDDYPKEDLSNLLYKMNSDLKNVFSKAGKKRIVRSSVKRQTKSNNGLNLDGTDFKEKMLRRKENFKQPESIFSSVHSGLLRRLMERYNRLNNTRIQIISRLNKKPTLYKNKVLKRSAFKKRKPKPIQEKSNEESSQTKNENELENSKTHNRTRRNVIFTRSQLDSENEIDVDDFIKPKFYQILKTLRKPLKDIPINMIEIDEEEIDKESSQESSNAIEEDIELKTKLSDDNASLRIIDKTDNDGMMAMILEATNNILNKFEEKIRKFYRIMSLIEQ